MSALQSSMFVHLVVTIFRAETTYQIDLIIHFAYSWSLLQSYKWFLLYSKSDAILRVGCPLFFESLLQSRMILSDMYFIVKVELYLWCSKYQWCFLDAYSLWYMLYELNLTFQNSRAKNWMLIVIWWYFLDACSLSYCSDVAKFTMSEVGAQVLQPSFGL